MWISDWVMTEVTNCNFLSQVFEDPYDLKPNETKCLSNNFNDDISQWDMSNVTTMWKMFDGCEELNQPIGDWDVSNVQNMLDVFNSASEFNQDICEWNVSQVPTMEGKFCYAGTFNQPVAE